MPTEVKIGPITRVEGHLEVEATCETVSGTQQVIDARCSSTMFRGFERILVGRDPRDATHYTQRICGVCPVSHAMASSLALEDALQVSPRPNGRIMRNLVLGANFLQSHILHFYHLAVPDYVNTEGVLNHSPWKPLHAAPDLVTGSPAATLVGHYVEALEMRRRAHRLGAIYGGKLPTPANFVPGGSTGQVTAGSVQQFRALLDEIRRFIDGVYLPDVQAVADGFAAYAGIGRGCGNLLAYGVFDLDDAGTSKLLRRGRHTNGASGSVDPGRIKEYVSHSWYTPASGNLSPSGGVTEPDPDKADGYTWLKAPRYDDAVHEVGPLARMWVNGDYRNGISVIDRLRARALETKKVADAMAGWSRDLSVGMPAYRHQNTPGAARGLGLTEAPRGALGHWLGISNGRIGHYQIVSPTGWNASPRDDRGQRGAMEQALVGTPVRDIENPVEVLRVVHSFDPCLSCSVHMLRPDPKAVPTTIHLVP
jgi:hydrogenase large subunit